MTVALRNRTGDTHGIVIPKSCIAGINDLTIGFATTVIGACVTYWMGVRTVERDLRPPTT